MPAPIAGIHVLGPHVTSACGQRCGWQAISAFTPAMTMLASHHRAPWCKQTAHAEKIVRLVRRRGWQAVCHLAVGHHLVRGKLVLSSTARRDADPDGAGAAGSGLPLL